MESPFKETFKLVRNAKIISNQTLDAVNDTKGHRRFVIHTLLYESVEKIQEEDLYEIEIEETDDSTIFKTQMVIVDSDRLEHLIKAMELILKSAKFRQKDPTLTADLEYFYERFLKSKIY